MRQFLSRISPVWKVLAIITASVLAGSAATSALTAKPVPPATTIMPGLTVACHLVERQTIHYVDRPVTVVDHTERVKTIPTTLHHFSLLEVLEQWLAGQDANNTTLYFQSPGDTIDCDDYALALQQRAIADGYIISFEIIGRSEYNYLFSSKLPPSQSLHAINLAVIGNAAYYIEPQTGEITLATHLD